MSYLISTQTNEIVAITHEALKSGEIVSAAYSKTQESVNANRDCNLVNAFDCKVSNAEKWEKLAEVQVVEFATQINENEFFIG